MIQIFSRFIKFQLPTSFLMKNVAAVNVLAKKGFTLHFSWFSRQEQHTQPKIIPKIKKIEFIENISSCLILRKYYGKNYSKYEKAAKEALVERQDFSL